jgi:phenylacetate-CoA ligase
LQQAFAELLTRRVGVDIKTELVAQGGTAALTQIDSRQKPVRLIDERPKAKA